MSPHPPRVDVCIIQGADAIADDRAPPDVREGQSSAGSPQRGKPGGVRIGPGSAGHRKTGAPHPMRMPRDLARNSKAPIESDGRSRMPRPDRGAIKHPIVRARWQKRWR
jgi:hypothetical protein